MLCRVIYASCERVCIVQMPVVFAVALFHSLSPSPFGVPELFLSPLDSLVGFGFHFSGTSAQFSSHTLSLFQPHLSFLFSFCTHAFLNIAYEISITSQTACIASLTYPAPPFLATHSVPVFQTPYDLWSVSVAQFTHLRSISVAIVFKDQVVLFYPPRKNYFSSKKTEICIAVARITRRRKALGQSSAPPCAQYFQ